MSELFERLCAANTALVDAANESAERNGNRNWSHSDQAAGVRAFNDVLERANDGKRTE